MEKDVQQLNFHIDPDIAEGIYTNLAIISHSPAEFVIDFVRVMPGMPKAPIKSRLILTPEHAKRLAFALQENIARYESIHGTIKIPEGTPPNMPINFNPSAGLA